MWLSRLAGRIKGFLSPAVKIMHSAGAGVLLAMMLLTASDVTLRYIFNRPILGSLDLTEYMMAIVVSFSLAYCALEKGHVKVDIIVSNFPRRVQAIFDCFTNLFSLFLLILITWQSLANMWLLYKSGLKSTVLLIPRFPFAGLVFLGCAFFTLVLLVNFLESLSEALRR